MLNTREERLKQLLEQAKVLREQRVPAAEADINAKLMSDLGYNFAKVGQAFSKQSPERSDFAFTPAAAPRLAEQEKQVAADIRSIGEESLYDPTSEFSKTARAIYGQRLGLEPQELGGISAGELSKLPSIKGTAPSLSPQEKAQADLDLAQKKADIQLARQKELIDYRSQKEPMMEKAKGNVEIRNLPAEEQEVVKNLAKKNADKISIANQITSTIKILDDPKVSREQKITQGRQMLKVLNSTQGQDAVGAEEAKRLGSYLEASIGINWDSPRAFGDFGINLEGFKQQAKLTNQAIIDSINANQSEIQKRYAQYGIERKPVPIEQPEKPRAMAVKLTEDQIREGMLQAARWLKSPNAQDQEKGRALFNKLKVMQGR